MILESIGIPELKSAVKYARQTGYVTHDIRNPEFYTTDQVEQIKQLDKSFMDAANSLHMSFEDFAGYGESKEANDASNELADKLVDADEEDIKFRVVDIYDMAMPYFKMSMDKWLSNSNERQIAKIRQYWKQHHA